MTSYKLTPDAEGLDLLEISGGYYEQPRLMGIDGLEPAFEGEGARHTCCPVKSTR